MSERPTFPHREFAVDVYVQPETGLRMAVSDAVPGFSLAAKTDDEMDVKLTDAIAEFLEFAGYRPVKLSRVRKEPLGGFKANRFSIILDPAVA